MRSRIDSQWVAPDVFTLTFLLRPKIQRLELIAADLAQDDKLVM
jgi:hypothetical protein